MLPWAHPSTQSKWHLDRFNHFCTAYGSVVGHARICLSTKNCPFAWGHLDPLSTTWFLEPTRTHNPNGISIWSAVFAQITAERPYALQREALSPLKMAPSHNGSGPHLICGTLCRYQPTTQTASGSVQSFLQSSWMWQTDRWTDHATRFVTTVVGPTAMRPKMGHMTLTTPLWGGNLSSYD